MYECMYNKPSAITGVRLNNQPNHYVIGRKYAKQKSHSTVSFF